MALAFPVVERARAAPRHWRELRFSLAIPAGILEGSVDLCFEEADGLVVVDYKTDRVMEKDVPARMKAHQTQLAVYALALQQITGRPVRALNALFLSPGIAREVAVTEALLAHARAALERSGPAAQGSLPLGIP